ncbi:MAG TPA: hypothetical protein VNQ90_12770 [Chthoniobacteraceae bacterium]|nr:hypothetical protein [Chthoniobacteraceae bacterium]
MAQIDLLSSERWKLQLQLRRCLKPLLNPTEYLVADFIFDRTVAWGKTEETIFLNQMINGMLRPEPNENHEVWFAAPVGLKTTVLRDILARMVRHGVLEKRQGVYGSRGAASYCLKINYENLMLKLPKSENQPQKGLQCSKLRPFYRTQTNRL